MSITSQSKSAGTKEERLAAFMKSLSDESVNPALHHRLGVHSLLGLRPRKGQAVDLENLVQTGLALSAGENLAEHLGMESKEFLRRYVRMSDSTIRRRFKYHQPLSTAESDRVVRYARLFYFTINLMNNNKEYARDWLSSPAYALGGSTPLETAVTETGGRRVEDLLLALEYGNFS